VRTRLFAISPRKKLYTQQREDVITKDTATLVRWSQTKNVSAASRWLAATAEIVISPRWLSQNTTSGGFGGSGNVLALPVLNSVGSSAFASDPSNSTWGELDSAAGPSTEVDFFVIQFLLSLQNR